MKANDQRKIDETLLELDGTPNKASLGANAVLGVSLGVARAASASAGQPLYMQFNDGEPITLPVPMFNIINGGRHAENSTDFQEFMALPLGFDTFKRAMQAGVEVYHALMGGLRNRALNTNVGDEGGFAPQVATNRQAVELLIEAIERVGYKPGEHFFLALDVAASELSRRPGRYTLPARETSLSAENLVDIYDAWISDYPIISIEDGLGEDDWNALGHDDAAARLARSASGRRHLHDEPQADSARHRARLVQRRAGQAQSDRHRQRDAGRYPHDARRGLGDGNQPPFRRDRRLLDSRPRRRRGRGADKDGRARARRADSEVQPPAADRGNAGGEGRGTRGKTHTRSSWGKHKSLEPDPIC